MNKKILIGMISTLMILSAIIPTISLARTDNAISSQPLVKKITVENAPTPKLMQKQTKAITPQSQPSTQSRNIAVASTEAPEYHPAISKDPVAGTLLGAYALETDSMNADIYFTFSTDNGQTWDPGAFIQIEGKEDYPALEYWGRGTTFFGTFCPDQNDAMGSAQYLFEADDPTDITTWQLISWDWTTYNQRDKESPDIATYSDVGDHTWFYGVQVDTESSDYSGQEGEHIPILYFANYNDETQGWAWWWNNFEYSAHTAIDMDENNGYMYAVWDYDNASEPAQNRDILLGMADVHDWWAENWSLNWYTVGESNVNETYPDVGAVGDRIQIVAQSDEAGNQDIICFYSSDGGDTWSQSTVVDEAADELYPRIVSYGEYATCTFVKDGDLYCCQTTDGGITWSTPLKINDNAGTVPVDYRTNDITITGDTLWTDTRAGNEDIYFDNVGGQPPWPFLEVKTFSGGLGVSVVLTNTGTGPGTNVKWELAVNGGVLGRINKVVNGTYPSLAVNEEHTEKTGLFFGLGTITITVTMTCDEGDSETRTTNGTQLLFFTKVNT